MPIASSAKASILPFKRVVRFVHNAAFTVLFKKLGQPQLLENFAPERKSLFPQAAQ
jgi:hypothetical protein